MNAKQSSARFHWLVCGPFVVAVVLLAVLGLASAQILSAVRAYVGGESLWSKGQKDAVYHLTQYAQTRDSAEYARYLAAIAVPLGDRIARIELDRPEPDRAVARRGFLQGGNHADDVDAMIWLYRSFRGVPSMADAIRIWAEADAELEHLHRLAEQLHRRVQTGDAAAANMRDLAVQLAPLNARLTRLEDRFSATMGEASRNTQRLIELATLVLAFGLIVAAAGLNLGLQRRKGHAEQALRESEQRFRQLWETAPDAIVVLDDDMRVSYANAAVHDVFGHAPESLVGADIGVLMPQKSRQAHRDGVACYLRSGQKKLNWRSVKVQGLHRDGHEIPLEIAFSHVELDGSHQFAGFLRDVSRRDQAAQALRASEERLKRALDATSLCLWDYRIETGNVYLSESWSQRLGGPAEETLTTFAELAGQVPVEERDGLMRALVTALKDPHGSYRVEHRVRNRDGDWLWNLSIGRVVERDAQGRALRMVGTNLDITERKRAESTRLALETQLRESQKMEAIGTLAAGIAHDFNNILGAIIGNLNLAREEVGPGHSALLSLEQIGTSARRARTLVQQILAFGRRQPHELTNRVLAPMLEETLALLRSTLPAGISLETRLAAEPLQVMANATHMQQVLMNLCTNAWHALPGGSGRIEVGLEALDRGGAAPRPAGLPPGAYAHVWVRDSGCGMDAETRSRIFEPFFTTKPVGRGTGLGLSVVHGIVAAHRGAITVDSAPLRGSTFHLYFPQVSAHVPATAPSGWGDFAATQRDSGSLGDGCHVLCIDDDAVMLLLVERLLLRMGCRVTCHADPRSAIEAVRAKPHGFDLVVTDYNMPDLSGLDVARAIGLVRGGLPVLISSGHLTDEQRAELADSGVREVIAKENTIEELGPAVARLLHGRAAAAPRASVSEALAPALLD